MNSYIDIFRSFVSALMSAHLIVITESNGNILPSNKECQYKLHLYMVLCYSLAEELEYHVIPKELDLITCARIYKYISTFLSFFESKVHIAASVTGYQYVMPKLTYLKSILEIYDQNTIQGTNDRIHQQPD